MNESKFWKQIKDNLAKELNFMKRIDAANGVPDVFLLTKNEKAVWTELKAKPTWPKRATTKTDFGLAKDQSVWLYNYARGGGKSYIFVWIENQYLLFKGCDALKIAQKVTKQEAIDLALFCFDTKMQWNFLKKEFEYGSQEI